MNLCISVACRSAPSWVQPVSHKPLTDRVTRHFLSYSSAVQLVKGLFVLIGLWRTYLLRKAAVNDKTLSMM